MNRRKSKSPGEASASSPSATSPPGSPSDAVVISKDSVVEHSNGVGQPVEIKSVGLSLQPPSVQPQQAERIEPLPNDARSPPPSNEPTTSNTPPAATPPTEDFPVQNDTTEDTNTNADDEAPPPKLRDRAKSEKKPQTKKSPRTAAPPTLDSIAEVPSSAERSRPTTGSSKKLGSKQQSFREENDDDDPQTTVLEEDAQDEDGEGDRYAGRSVSATKRPPGKKGPNGNQPLTAGGPKKMVVAKKKLVEIDSPKQARKDSSVREKNAKLPGKGGSKGKQRGQVGAAPKQKPTSPSSPKAKANSRTRTRELNEDVSDENDSLNALQEEDEDAALDGSVGNQGDEVDALEENLEAVDDTFDDAIVSDLDFEESPDTLILSSPPGKKSAKKPTTGKPKSALKRDQRRTNSPPLPGTPPMETKETSSGSKRARLKNKSDNFAAMGLDFSHDLGNEDSVVPTQKSKKYAEPEPPAHKPKTPKSRKATAQNDLPQQPLNYDPVKRRAAVKKLESLTPARKDDSWLNESYALGDTVVGGGRFGHYDMDTIKAYELDETYVQKASNDDFGDSRSVASSGFRYSDRIADKYKSTRGTGSKTFPRNPVSFAKPTSRFQAVYPKDAPDQSQAYGRKQRPFLMTNTGGGQDSNPRITGDPRSIRVLGKTRPFDARDFPGADPGETARSRAASQVRAPPPTGLQKTDSGTNTMPVNTTPQQQQQQPMSFWSHPMVSPYMSPYSSGFSSFGPLNPFMNPYQQQQPLLMNGPGTMADPQLPSYGLQQQQQQQFSGLPSLPLPPGQSMPSVPPTLMPARIKLTQVPVVTFRQSYIIEPTGHAPGTYIPPDEMNPDGSGSFMTYISAGGYPADMFGVGEAPKLQEVPTEEPEKKPRRVGKLKAKTSSLQSLRDDGGPGGKVRAMIQNGEIGRKANASRPPMAASSFL